MGGQGLEQLSEDSLRNAPVVHGLDDFVDGDRAVIVGVAETLGVRARRKKQEYAAEDYCSHARRYTESRRE
jgi:nitrite reductase/ring-hydroxylating ferredoxin subunit